MDMDTVPTMQSCYEKTAAKRAAVKEEELLPINIDIPAANGVVMGSMPKFRALKDELKAQLVTFDEKQLDDLEDLAQGMAYAHVLFQTVDAPVGGLVQLNEQAMEFRDRLMTTAQYAVKLGLVPAARLNEVTGTIGYRNVGFDLARLGIVLRDEWHALEGKVGLTSKDIDDGKALAEQLLEAAALREHNAERHGPAAEERQRAYTLFCRAYDELRSAVQYVRRHEGDAESIAPSLYAGRGGRGKKADDKSATPEPTTPATPAPAAGATQPFEAAPVRNGARGGNPFAGE